MSYWKVIGGEDKGGILVRTGKALDSAKSSPERVSFQAILKEVELEKKDGRLCFELVEGTGPSTGWVSLSASGKTLVEPTDAPAADGVEIAPMGTLGDGSKALPVAVLFPGQGSQYVKMMTGVKDLPKVQDMLEKAKPILGWDVLDLCLNGPEEKLEETQFCQPAMFIAGLAGLEKLRSENEEAATKCQVVAGLSLGEYTALCAAGVMEFDDALKLVKLRGEAMQEAALASKQKMLSVAGLERSKLEELCKAAAKKEGPGAVCSIANALFPKGFSCGGTEKAIGFLEASAMEAGALQAKQLKTAGAFHTALMQPAADKLKAAIEEARPRMKSPSTTVYMNADSLAYRPGCPVDRIVANMNKQLTSNVLWEASVQKMIKEEKITEFYECGPMKQIKAMIKRIDPAAWKTTTNIEV